MKIHTRTATAIFLLCLFLLAAVNIAAPDRDFSENENRYLQQFPAFTWQRLADGSFTKEFEAYITDQFVFRDQWISVKILAELALQKDSSNGVYFTRENGLIEMFDTLDRARFEKNLGVVRQFSDTVRDNYGIAVHTLLVPTSSQIYRDSLPAFAPEIDQQALLAEAAAALHGNLVEVSAVLTEHRDEAVYFRTDHHWTSLGAFYAANRYLAAVGLPERVPSEFVQETMSESFYGTTWSKASLFSQPPDTLTAWRDATAAVIVDYGADTPQADSLYERSFLAQKDKYSVFLNSNRAVTRIHTTAANGRRLLLIKDSYANAFAQFLLRDYEEIILIDPRYYQQSYTDFIADNNITDVLLLYYLKGFAADTNIFFLTQ